MPYSKDEKDWLGNERKVHYDDSGKKIGISKEEKDWLGKDRTVHYDTDGSKTGISKEERDWLGNDRTINYDKKGNKTGISKVEKDRSGKEFIQHYDTGGNKTHKSAIEKNFWGQSILRHTPSSTGGNSAIGILIFVVLIIFVLLALFSYPYTLIDDQFSPFGMDWLENKNVWIFAASSWLLLFSLISNLKLLFSNRNGESLNSYIAENGLVRLILLLIALPVFLAFLIKAKVSFDFITIASIALALISGLITFAFLKTKNGPYFIGTVALASIGSIIYLKGTSFSQFAIEKTNISVTNQPTNSNSVAIIGSSNGGDYEITDEWAENQFKNFNTAVMNRSNQELSDILSNQGIAQYMKLKNISKADVVSDKRNYAKRWKLNSVSYYDFKRKNKQDYSYTIKAKVSKTEDPGVEKFFLIKGIIGFDAEGKINKIIDEKTLNLSPENKKPITDMYEIIGSTWVFQGNETMDPIYIKFLPDGKMEHDLINDVDHYWTIENGQLVWGKTGFSTITCSIENGNLSCLGSNNSGTEWNMVGYRKK
jgi:hypothetical protein